MGLPMAEVYEVASFYAHFDIVLDGERDPAPLTIRVCDSLTCEMMGAQDLLARLPGKVGPGVRVVRAPCMGRCDCAPVAEVGHRHIDHATTQTLAEAAKSGDTHPVIPAYTSYEDYVAGGGYALLRDCLAGNRDRDEIVQTMEHSGLRGLGGAGFPAGLKWKLVRQQPGPRICAINGDEGEPGTFKDRFYLETDPHRFLEGMLVAGWACEVATVYVYIRDEYPAVLKILADEIARLEAEGLTGGMKIDLRRGAGAYICGEESAMFESIEGKRGLPRHKPPFPTERGLFGLPAALSHRAWPVRPADPGPQRGNGLLGARHRREGPGVVRRPRQDRGPQGLSLLFRFRAGEGAGREAGAGRGHGARADRRALRRHGRERELIDEHCGGMAESETFKAYLPGGASGGILPASLADLPLDFGGPLAEHGCFVGSHAVVVLSERDSMRDVALNLMRFFEDESCGQCTPCRNGTEKAVRMMAAGQWDADLLADLSGVMRDASICGLGQAAPNPLDCLLKYFPEELS
jgi:formate dehydrogenase